MQVRQNQTLRDQELEAIRNRPHVLFDCHLSGRVRGVLVLFGERNLDTEEAAILRSFCNNALAVVDMDAKPVPLLSDRRNGNPA